MHGAAVVAGVGESTYYVRGRSPDTEFQLACTAIRRAVEDAGLELAEIDGFVTYMDTRNDALRLANALGIEELRWAARPPGRAGATTSGAWSSSPTRPSRRATRSTWWCSVRSPRVSSAASGGRGD